MNVILRPVYNRPEMLKLSLDYEIMAREYFDMGNFTTLFLIEKGSPSKTIDLVSKYPYNKHIEMRPRKFGLSMNILEGMKQAFNITKDYIIYIEDDILVHKTYFQYMYVLLELMNDESFSVLSAYNQNDNGSVDKVYRGNHYAALAPLISKTFFELYISRLATKKYYNNQPAFILGLNNAYKEEWGKRYKYGNSITHWEQAGAINRCCDAAIIEHNMYVIMPQVNRQQHIGFYGKNRPGGVIPGSTYEERLANLSNIITDANKMYSLTMAKAYNDYTVFSSKLKQWDGSLRWNKL